MSEEHGPSLGAYIGVFLALMALTGLTVAVAYMDLGALAAPVALAIAAVKATLVITIFMHVRYESRLIKLYAVSGFVFVAILLVITMGEHSGREPQPDDPLGPANQQPVVMPLEMPTAAPPPADEQ